MGLIKVNGLTRRQFGKGLSSAALLAMSSGTVSTLFMEENTLSSEIVDFDAQSLSNAIRTKKLSCVEVMQAYLAQIDRFNPTYNAIVSLRDYNELILYCAYVVSTVVTIFRRIAEIVR